MPAMMNIVLLFTKLNITEGKMESMITPKFKWWFMNILRLKYLKQFNVDIDYL